jgi:hypothetical protein
MRLVKFARILGKIFLIFALCSFSGQARAGTKWIKLDHGGREGHVYAIAADAYEINVGISGGAAVGDYYLAYEDGSDVYDANGALLGSYKIPLAVLKVKQVSTNGSTCEIAFPSKGWVIQKGDKVMPVSYANANHLRFATYRATPARPHLKGYTGRWLRVPQGQKPASVIVNYYYQWMLPGLPPNAPPAAPGFYYMDAPASWPFAVEAVRVPEIMASSVPSYEAPLPVYEAPQPVYDVPQPVYAPPLPQAVYLPNPLYSAVAYDFDVNKITDARLIRTFPLSQVEMYALEIQHKTAWNFFYSNKRYAEAFDAFCRQSIEYRGNYLSPYWAGQSALKLGNVQSAMAWFEMALRINASYQPARDALMSISDKIKRDAKSSSPPKKK